MSQVRSGVLGGRRELALGAGFLATAVLLGVAVAEGRYTLVGLMTAGLIGLVLSSRPVRLVTAIIVAAVFGQSLTYWLGLPPALSYTVDALVILLFFIVGFRAVSTARLVVHWWVWPLTAALFASAAVAPALTSQLLQACAGYIIPLLLFVAVANLDLGREQESFVFKVLALMVALQIPLTGVQWLIYTSSGADRIGGTFGRSGTTFMGVFIACAWCFLTAAAVLRPRRETMLFMGVALAPLMFGEVKAGFLLAVFGAVTVAMFFTLLSARKHRAPAAIALATVPAAALLLIYRYAPWLISNSAQGARSGLQLVTSPDAALAYASGFSRTGQANRIEVLRIIIRENASRGTQLLGNGPGALSREASHEGPVSSDWLTGILAWATSGGRYLMELGVIGVLAQLTFIGGFMGVGLRLFNRSGRHEDRVLGLGLAGAALTFALGGFYTSAWQFDGVLVPLSVIAGIAASRGGRLLEQESS